MCVSSLATETGVASYYSTKTGTKTASGERLHNGKLTAAHKKLPFGTKVKVTNLRNNKSVIVKITDRGPYRKGRIIDLSLAAAKQLDMMKAGVVKVKVEIVDSFKKKPDDSKQVLKRESLKQRGTKLIKVLSSSLKKLIGWK